MKRRFRESTRVSTYYAHNEGISDLAKYIADTMDDEVYEGNYIVREMMSLSGDGAITIEEKAMESVDVNMSIFGTFDMLYSMEANFENAKVQKNFEDRLNSYIEDLADEGITEDDPDFYEELDTLSYTDYVGVDINAHITEIDENEAEVKFTLIVDGIKIDDEIKDFSTDEIVNGDYENWVTKVIQRFFNLV